MRRRRSRGLGCFGCLSFTGILIAAAPIIVIGLIVYFLVQRSRQSTQAPAPGPYTPPSSSALPQAPPTASAGGFCNQCGAPMSPGARFCPACGAAAN